MENDNFKIREERIKKLVEICGELHSKFSKRLAKVLLTELVDMDNELYELENNEKRN